MNYELEFLLNTERPEWNNTLLPFLSDEEKVPSNLAHPHKNRKYQLAIQLITRNPKS